MISSGTESGAIVAGAGAGSDADAATGDKVTGATADVTVGSVGVVDTTADALVVVVTGTLDEAIAETDMPPPQAATREDTIRIAINVRQVYFGFVMQVSLSDALRVKS